MAWTAAYVDTLGEPAAWAYRGGQPPACEPAALAALALLGHGRVDAAKAPLDWLVERQSPDGRIGINATQYEPNWPTLWAILAWTAEARASAVPPARGRYADAVELAIRWMLTQKGKPIDRSRELGHDSTLVGWPWVESTHSWMEPTCLAVLALRTTGRASDPRCEEAIRLVTDRLLPAGGANYGNTIVLGQELLPHLQPTGLVMLALAGTRSDDERIRKSVEYLSKTVAADLPGSSLAYALMGLSAWRKYPEAADGWLAASVARTRSRNGFLPVIALSLLAALDARNPLIMLPRFEDYSQ
jgi:hypothetical protein